MSKPSSSLKQKTINGFKWSFIDNVGRLGGQFVIGIILARILSPADFGLVGMLAIFIVIGKSLTNSGFGQALIQKKNADHVDFSTVFYFNIFASVVIYFIIFLGSPLIAKFYSEPQLIRLTKVICLVFIVDAFGLIHTTHLEKNLDFKAPSIIGVISIFISGAISIFLAYKGFGVWALVVNTVLRSFIATVLLWKVSSWRPQLIFGVESIKGLFAYGSKILLAGLLNSVFNNIYHLIIGRLFQAQSLGYYTRAVQFTNLPVNTITVVIQTVAYPVFSSIQDDNQKLLVGYSKIIRILSAVILPLMVIIFTTASPIIKHVLGEKWLPVVPYLQILCVYSWLQVVYSTNNLIITAKGRSDYYLHLQIINKVLVIVSILLTYKYGITEMIYGHMVATIISYVIGSFYLKRMLNITLFYQIKNILPFFMPAVFMLISCLYATKYATNDFQYLLIAIVFGLGIYIFILWILKIKELKEGIEFVSDKLKSLHR